MMSQVASEHGRLHSQTQIRRPEEGGAILERLLERFALSLARFASQLFPVPSRLTSSQADDELLPGSNGLASK